MLQRSHGGGYSLDPAFSVDALSCQVEEGEKAKIVLWEHNTPLVVRMAGMYIDKAKKYGHVDQSIVGVEDLMQIGFITLLVAAENYEPGAQEFKYFAYQRIRQSMLIALYMQARNLEPPFRAFEDALRIDEKEFELENKYRRLATDLELASATGLSLLEITHYRTWRDRTLSIEGAFTEANLVIDQTVYEPETESTRQATRLVVASTLPLLKEREQRVLKLRYGIDDCIPRTLEEVGKELGLSREVVRQTEAKAFSKLKHPSNLAQLYRLLEA